MNIQIAEASPEMLELVAEFMREQDRLECWRLGMTPLEALTKSRRESDMNAVCLIDGEPLAAYGLITTRHAVVGFPWLLTTDLVEHHKRTFLEGSLEVVDFMLTRRPILNAMVDAEHRQALRWAEWLGFTIGTPVLYGPMKRPFRLLFKKAEDFEVSVLMPQAAGVH